MVQTVLALAEIGLKPQCSLHTYLQLKLEAIDQSTVGLFRFFKINRTTNRMICASSA